MQVPLLAGLSPVAQNLIIDSIEYRDFDPDEWLVREGVNTFQYANAC